MNGKSGGMGSWLIRLLSNIPIIVSGIEKIHGDSKSGVDKKQLALESLGLAGYTAENVDPNDQPAIAAALDLASTTIDGVKAVYNAAQSKAPAPAAAAPGAPGSPDPNTGAVPNS